MKMPKTIRVSDYAHSKIKQLAAEDRENIENYVDRILMRHIASKTQYLSRLKKNEMVNQ